MRGTSNTLIEEVSLHMIANSCVCFQQSLLLLYCSLAIASLRIPWVKPDIWRLKEGGIKYEGSRCRVIQIHYAMYYGELAD